MVVGFLIMITLPKWAKFTLFHLIYILFKVVKLCVKLIPRVFGTLIENQLDFNLYSN
jgi:hypothetical protein